MGKKRFCFYVSGKASRLMRLLASSSPIIDDTHFVLNDNAPHAALAEALGQRGIAYAQISYEELGLCAGERNRYVSDLLLDMMKKHRIDYCYCFGGRILRGALLAEYKNRIVNFHPSVLPMFPGERAIDRALEQQAFLLGNTAHFIDEGIDTGPVIMQSVLPRNRFETYETVLDLQLPMIEQIHRWICEDRLSAGNGIVTVRDADRSQAVFFPKIEEAKGQP